MRSPLYTNQSLARGSQARDFSHGLLTKQELNDINHAVDQLEIVGDRYNQEQKQKTGK